MIIGRDLNHEKDVMYPIHDLAEDSFKWKIFRIDWKGRIIEIGKCCMMIREGNQEIMCFHHK